MAAVQPQIFGATATTSPVTYTVTGRARQFLIEHLNDTTNNLVITWNGGGNWTVRPGVSLSMYLKGGVVTFTVATNTSTATWQAFAQD